MSNWMVNKKKRAESAWQKYEAHSCDNSYEQLEAATQSCDEAQYTLEQHSCGFLEFVEQTRNDFAPKWQSAVTDYQVAMRAIRLEKTGSDQGVPHAGDTDLC